MKTDRAHAVRWAQRVIERMGNEIQYSKWHWTGDACMTYCGKVIQVASDTPHTLPETDDDPARVTCARCRLRMQPNTGINARPETHEEATR